LLLVQSPGLIDIDVFFQFRFEDLRLMFEIVQIQQNSLLSAWVSIPPRSRALLSFDVLTFTLYEEQQMGPTLISWRWTLRQERWMDLRLPLQITA
jgi:hypothetical protein